MSAIVPGRVSVIIPAYKAEAFIRRSVESVLAQTYPDVEIVIVDDDSPDNLEEVLRPYRNHIIYYKHPENRGISEARNSGIRLSSGEKLAFLDQDDWWPENLLAEIVNQVSPNRGIVYDNFIVSDATILNDITLIKTVFSESPQWKCDRLTRENMDYIFQGAPMFKTVLHRSDCERVNGFDSRFFAVEDFNFFVKLLASGVELNIVAEPKGYYRVHSESTTVMISSFQECDYPRKLRAYNGWLEMSRTMPRELDLSKKAVDICRKGERYWSARYTETLLRQYISQGDYYKVTNGKFLWMLMSSLTKVTEIKIKVALGKVVNRIRMHRA